MSTNSSSKVLFLLCLISGYSGYGAHADEHTEKIVSPVSSGKFELLKEPSGIIALNDKSFIVVEDEAMSALRRLSAINNDPYKQKFKEIDQPIKPRFFKGPLKGPLDDLEGIARISPTQFIVTGSHENARKGKWPDREKIVLFTLEDNKITSAQMRKNLYKKLKKRYPKLRDIMKKTDIRKRQPFNIEAIAFDRKRSRLYIGLRTPIADDSKQADAYIIRLDNPLEYLEGDNPIFGEKLHRLYLRKGGIRALAYDDRSDKLLIISRRESGKKKRFILWSVPADSLNNPIRHKSRDKDLFDNVEGLTTFSDGILFIRDNGDKSDPKTDDWFILRRAQLGLYDKQPE